MQLDAASVLPMYIQMAEKLKTQIARGQFQHGERIPSEGELCGVFGVSRNTVRRAIDLLVEEEILTRRQGKGTFVTVPVHFESYAEDGSFTSSCTSSGSIPGTVILTQDKIGCPPDIAKTLNLTGAECVYLKRLRLVDRVPAIVEEDYFPPEYGFLLHVDLTDKSLLEVLRNCRGEYSAELIYALGVQNADEGKAKLLRAPKGYPLLKIEQTVYVKGKPMYYNIQYVRSDIYRSAIYTSRG